MAQVGPMVKRLREAKGWSQAELARRVNVTRPYITMLEAGARRAPSLKVLRALARALGVKLTELLQR